MPSYTEQDLDETLKAFQYLVDAICVAMPGHPEQNGDSLIELVTGSDPHSLPSSSFACRFLSQATKPHLRILLRACALRDINPSQQCRFQ
jgi:hypothetical protein